ASSGFDIWQQQCPSADTNCTLTITHTNNSFSGTDTYTSTASGDLATTVLPASAVPISCAGQTVIVADAVYRHSFSTSSPVFVVGHTTVDEMKAAANNGQAHVAWCIGLDSNDQWKAIKVNDAVQEGSLWVHLAGTCPKKNPSSGAPCITRQYGDGN